MVMTGSSADALDSILDEIDSVMYNRIPATPYNSTRDSYPLPHSHVQQHPHASSTTTSSSSMKGNLMVTRALSNTLGKNYVDASGKRVGTPFVHVPNQEGGVGGGTIYTSHPPRKTHSVHNVSAARANPASSSSSSTTSSSNNNALTKNKSKHSSEPSLNTKTVVISSSSPSTTSLSPPRTTSSSNMRSSSSISPRPAPSSSSTSSPKKGKKTNRAAYNNYHEEGETDSDDASVIEENYDINRLGAKEDSISFKRDKYRQPQEGGVDAHLLDDILSEIQSAYS